MDQEEKTEVMETKFDFMKMLTESPKFKKMNKLLEEQKKSEEQDGIKIMQKRFGSKRHDQFEKRKQQYKKQIG